MGPIPIVEFQAVIKSFSGILANDGISLAVAKGEIHAIVGENGAGKTTLMNMLAGIYSPDDGEIRVKGRRVNFSGVQAAIHAGIGMVHQHFMLVDRFSVLQNIILGCEGSRSLLNFSQARLAVERICQSFGLGMALDREAGSLPVGLRQRLEIIKLLYRGGDILIFDEPTAVLTPAETEGLLDLLRTMREQGKTIIFVSHKLSEVLAIADRITVLRQGRQVATINAREVSRNQLVELMIGRSLHPAITREEATNPQTMMELRNVSCRDKRGAEGLRGLSLSLRSSEIYGIAGVAGNGQQELVAVLTGQTAVAAGEIWLEGTNLAGVDVNGFRNTGVRLIPEDRDRQGLIPTMTVWENLLLGQVRLPEFSRVWRLKVSQCLQFANEKVLEYDIRLHSVTQSTRSLSGGNRQKIVLARELSTKPKVLVASQPVRGLDVGAEQAVHDRLLTARNEGTSVVLISADLDEILTLSDRVGIMVNGEIVCEFQPGTMSVEEIGLYMLGGGQAVALA